MDHRVNRKDRGFGSQCTAASWICGVSLTSNDLVVARVHKGMMMALMFFGMDDLFGVFLFVVMWLSFLLSFLVSFVCFICFHLI
jgi:hypothetical protein